MVTRRELLESMSLALVSGVMPLGLRPFRIDLSERSGHSSGAPEKVQAAKGLWMAPRKDSTNQARADLPGRMHAAPQEVWKIATGGAVTFARNVTIHGRDAALILAGSVLQATSWTGETIWQKGKLGTSEVFEVDDFDGSGHLSVFVKTDVRTVMLVDLATGDELWRWQAEPSTFMAGYKFGRVAGGIRFYCFPDYSLNGYCFDFSNNLKNPKILWQRNYAGKFGAGYGPSIVLQDMDGDGKPDIVLSGKTPPRGLYQAVIDTETGDIKSETKYDPDAAASFPLGRPYGFLQAVPFAKNEKPNIVLVSCQVEEYLAATKNEGGKTLSKIWGTFIEKEWPTNDLEIRPQITSLTDLLGNGVVELIVGLWDGKMWRTLIIDPSKGYTAQRANLENYYFWGCYDINGDGLPEIIVSTERERRTARMTSLLALSGRTFEPVAEMKNARIFFSKDSLLSDDIAFMASRHNPLFVKRKGGPSGILIHLFDGEKDLGTYLWGGTTKDPVTAYPIAPAGFRRADLYRNRLLLSDDKGNIQRFDENLKPVGEKLPTQGRTCTPLVWAVGDRRELVVDLAGSMVVGGVPNFHENGKLESEWKVAGSMPVAHTDAQGFSRLAVTDLSNSEEPSNDKITVQIVYNPALMIYEAPIKTSSKAVKVALPDPPYIGTVPFGNDFHVTVNMQTGVHMNAQATYDKDGKMLWQDRAHGSHPQISAAADLNGDGQFEVISDDHGELRIYDSVGKLVSLHPGPPMYTMPIVCKLHSSDKPSILRANGILGLALITNAGEAIWQIQIPQQQLWRYFKSWGAIGDAAGNSKLTFGVLAEDGIFECIDLASGTVRWALDLHCTPTDTSIVAADIDGDGKDEFLLGLSDGRLLCISEKTQKGSIQWQAQFESGVANPIVADIDGDGVSEIILSTFDGCVRILKQ